MKTIVRFFVVALAVTGAFATTATTSASAKISAAKTSAMPAPRCPWNDPNGCGINNW